MPTKFKKSELDKMGINPKVLEEAYKQQFVLADHRKNLAKLEAIIRTQERDMKTALMKANDLGINEEISDIYGRLVLKIEYKDQGEKQIRNRLWVAKG
jgi:hypothetical protein